MNEQAQKYQQYGTLKKVLKKKKETSITSSSIQLEPCTLIKEQNSPETLALNTEASPDMRVEQNASARQGRNQMVTNDAYKTL